ncbi:hypothetical protein RMCBS344292_08879 [Rhizopus microsporus]|nr:hypothetical protein RMCBS344292_08879 [Rhizopus microsporus]
MVQKLKMLKEVVENVRPDKVASSWKLQVEQLFRESVLRSNQKDKAFFPALKDLDIGHLRESEFALSAIHPLIQALLSYENDDKVARCTNTLPDNDTDVIRWPDYEDTMYDQYQPSYRTCFGELKGEGSSDILSIMDFYRLGVFAKLEITSSNINGVLCFPSAWSINHILHNGSYKFQHLCICGTCNRYNTQGQKQHHVNDEHFEWANTTCTRKCTRK